MIPDKLLINLKIISKIQKNGRIARSYDGIISLENDVFYQSIKRFMTSDSRRQAIFEINSVITESVDILHHILNSKYMNKNFFQSDEYIKNCENINLILNELENARHGIDNLKFTYKNDPNTASQIDILILKINTTIKDVFNKLSYFQSFLQSNQINQQYYHQNDLNIISCDSRGVYNNQNILDNTSSNLASTSYQNSYQELNSIKIENGEDDDHLTMGNIEEEE
jgi:hypothetical protein